jgi:HK97 family phage prohead protease
MSERGPVEIRTAVLDAVAYPDRTIDLIAVPYDQWTVVEYRGGLIEESVAPGAFGAVAARGRKFTVNMEHNPDRWVGQVIGFPDDPGGLRAHIKVRRGLDGDQALDDAADGMLGASIGMAVGADGQTVRDNRRRITKAFLDHIALTARPAYAGAEILDVRSHPSVSRAPSSATPNLDKILAERRAETYGVRLT